jgi:hypothetical protein
VEKDESVCMGCGRWNDGGRELHGVQRYFAGVNPPFGWRSIDVYSKIDLFEELKTDLNQPSAGVYFVGSRRVQGTNHSAGF